jgi:hypothetical protein
MTESPIAIALDPAELEEFFAEIVRYLAAVDVFRSEGHEPSWRAEGTHTEVLR